MKRLLIILITIFLFITHQGLAQQTPGTKAFGVIDTADLRMTACSFEKEANAMVLFDKAEVTATMDSVVMWRHTRIKIFKDAAKELANIRLAFRSYHNFEAISAISAEAIRIENNTIIVSTLDPKLIYTDVADKDNKAFVFAFPEVKPGSVIEYRYKWKTVSPANFPSWFFQGAYPVRYSELTATISAKLQYNTIRRGYQEYVKDTSEVVPAAKKSPEMRRFSWAKANVNSFVAEPFITAANFNLQCLVFRLSAISNSYGGFIQAPDNSWLQVTNRAANDEDFGGQLTQNLSKEDAVLQKAFAMSTDDEKIAYLFNYVRNNIKWNNTDRWFTVDGVKKAWSKKIGNSTEINLILYMLLKKAGVNAYTMLVSTRNNEAIHPDFAGFAFINKAVTFVPVDSTHYYVLDASSKYHLYNEVPASLLNTFGVQMEKVPMLTVPTLVYLQNTKPALQNVTIDAEIKPDSKVSGSVSVNSYSYARATTKEAYDLMGPEKYAKAMREENNAVKITELQFENMETDSLPLIQRFKFSEELSGSDEKYIYFNPNMFSPLKTNPFLSERRVSDIDFGNCNFYNISCVYRLPKGYKIDALPKGIILNMEDKSIVFKRRVVPQEGSLAISYSVVFRRSVFGVQEYPFIRDFYKRMFEMLNEMVVLKKS